MLDRRDVATTPPAPVGGRAWGGGTFRFDAVSLPRGVWSWVWAAWSPVAAACRCCRLGAMTTLFSGHGVVSCFLLPNSRHTHLFNLGFSRLALSMYIDASTFSFVTFGGEKLAFLTALLCSLCAW